MLGSQGQVLLWQYSHQLFFYCTFRYASWAPPLSKPVSVKKRNSWNTLTGWWLLTWVTWTAQAAGLNWVVTSCFQQAQWLRMDTSSLGTTGRVFEGCLPSSKRWQDLALCFPSTKSFYVLNPALFKQLHAPEITVAVATVVLLWLPWREDLNLSRSHCALGKEWNKQRGSFMFTKTLFAQQGIICALLLSGKSHS